MKHIINNTRGSGTLELIAGCILLGLVMHVASGCGVATGGGTTIGFTSFVREVNRGKLPATQYVEVERFDIEPVAGRVGQ